MPVIGHICLFSLPYSSRSQQTRAGETGAFGMPGADGRPFTVLHYV